MELFASVLANEIKPDEQALWQEQPDPEKLVKAGITNKKRIVAVTYLIVGVLFLVFAYLAYNSYDRAPFVMCISVVIVCMLRLAVIIRGLIQAFKIAQKTLYVITNQRILTFYLWPKTIIVSYFRKDFINGSYTKFYNADGSGTIVLRGKEKVFLTAIKNVNQASSIIDKLIEDKI